MDVLHKKSKELLLQWEYNNVTISGDTRFDRVAQILEKDNSLDFIAEFKNDALLVVVGSTEGVNEREILFPVPLAGSRVIIAALVLPFTLAKTASWTLKPGELLPAVYVAMAVPVASVVPFNTFKTGAPLLFVTNPKVTASPDAAVPSAF